MENSLCNYHPLEVRFQRWLDQIAAWEAFAVIVSAPRLARVRRWFRRAIAPLIVQRASPRWGRGRWRAKT